MTFGVIYIITEEWRDDFTVDVLYSAPETIFPSPFHGSRASRNEKHTHLQLRTSTYQHKTNLPFFNFFKLLAFVIIILYTENREDIYTDWLVGYQANSAIHPSWVGKWVPASAGKRKTGMFHSVSGWMQGVQVKLWDPLKMHAIPECLRGVIMTRCYTNPR